MRKDKQLTEGTIYFGTEFQTTVAWLCCFEPVTCLESWWELVVEEVSLPHGA
jgi:hypothetical protein